MSETEQFDAKSLFGLFGAAFIALISCRKPSCLQMSAGIFFIGFIVYNSPYLIIATYVTTTDLATGGNNNLGILSFCPPGATPSAFSISSCGLYGSVDAAATGSSLVQDCTSLVTSASITIANTAYNCFEIDVSSDEFSLQSSEMAFKVFGTSAGYTWQYYTLGIRNKGYDPNLASVVQAPNGVSIVDLSASTFNFAKGKVPEDLQDYGLYSGVPFMTYTSSVAYVPSDVNNTLFVSIIKLHSSQIPTIEQSIEGYKSIIGDIGGALGTFELIMNVVLLLWAIYIVRRSMKSSTNAESTSSESRAVIVEMSK